MSIAWFFIYVLVSVLLYKFISCANRHELEWVREIEAIFPEEKILNPEIGIMYFKLPSGRFMCIYRQFDGSNVFIMKDNPPQPQMV